MSDEFDIDDVDLAETESTPTESATESTPAEPADQTESTEVKRVDPAVTATNVFDEIVSGLIGDARNEDYTDPSGGALTSSGEKFATDLIAPTGSRVRKYIEEKITAQLVSLMAKLDFVTSRTLVDVQALLQRVTSAKASKPAAPDLTIVERLATVLLAAELFKTTDEQDQAAQDLVEVLSKDLVDAYTSYESAIAAWADEVGKLGEGEEAPAKPTLDLESPVSTLAAELYETATGKKKLRSSRTGRSSTPRPAPAGDGVRRDLAAHIREALASTGDPLGVPELQKFNSTVYGEAEPSSGAIGAWFAKEPSVLAEKLGARLVEYGGKRCLQRI